MELLQGLKVALVHDYLIKIGGAEQVLEVLHAMFPKAPVYTLLYDEKATGGRYASYDIRTSWLNKAPQAHRLVDYYRALMPQAVESFDLSQYDLVISDASSFVKGVITQATTLHVSYIHTPTRFLWFDVQSHISRGKFARVTKSFIPSILHDIRQWDVIAAERPDVLVANSKTTQDRISKFYRRDSKVVYPPVNVAKFDIQKRDPKDFFLIISRLEPHKDIEIAIEACNAAKIPLKILGTGGYETRLRSLAGPTIEFMGRLDDTRRDQLLYEAQAFVALQKEDFGITMVEALAAGCPVIARASGGATEIVQSSKTGILLSEVTAYSVQKTLESFDSSLYNKLACSESVTRFSRENFEKSMSHLIHNHIKTKD